MMESFYIVPCKRCKKIPTVNKHPEIQGDMRYTMSHCGTEVNAHTETYVIVKWNELNYEEEEKHGENF